MAQPLPEIKIRHFDFYPTEWLEGTISLTHLERSVYITICAAIYAQGGPVEVSHVRKMCMGRGFERGLAGLVAKGKVIREATRLCNERCMKEVTKATLRVHEARTNGAKGGRPVKDLAKPNGSPPRKPNHQPSKENPSSPSESVAARAALPNGGAEHARDNENVWRPVGSAVPLAAAPQPPALTKGARAGEHWNFLQANGAAGEAERYLAAIETGRDCPSDEIFDAVEARMPKGDDTR